MDLCKVCEKTSMVMNADYTKKIPYRKAKDAKSFTCGCCISRGAPRKKLGELDELTLDLKEWRKVRKMTQTELAEVLKVDRSMVAKVESGEKVLPQRWEALISKM